MNELRCEKCPETLQKVCADLLKSTRTVRVLPCQSESPADRRDVEILRTVNTQFHGAPTKKHHGVLYRQHKVEGRG